MGRFILLIIGCYVLVATSIKTVNGSLKSSDKWEARFEPGNITVHMDDKQIVNLTLLNVNTLDLNGNVTVNIVTDSEIVHLQFTTIEIINGTWSGSFNFSAIFIGSANVRVSIRTDKSAFISNESLSITIIRHERIIDKVFTVSVAVLVSILYINFGAALDLEKVKLILVRPIGPAIGFFCQYLVLPLLSYGLGLLLFPNNIEMQLGLFFTGVSPSGGASNIWCVILGGNLDLSISMTAISTFAAFGMMPFWIFTLGRSIFEHGHLVVPYGRIASFAICLLIPLGIGLLLQKRAPKLAAILVRILKSFSSLLIVFIIIFAIATNLYLFKLLTWQIFLAGLGLPWISYCIGWFIALLMKREYEDRLAIAIEAGIKNTGIAIFILRFALGQPQADLTTVVPVAVAIMTPFPLLGYFMYLKGRECFNRRGKIAVPTEATEQ